MLFKSFIIAASLFSFSIYGLPSAQSEANSADSYKGWIVYIKDGDLKLFSAIKDKASKTAGVKIVNEILNSDLETFNALHVEGDEKIIREHFKDYSIFPNIESTKWEPDVPTYDDQIKLKKREESKYAKIDYKKVNWGLLRISQNTKKYHYPGSKAGENVNVYVLDGGVDGTHSNFKNKVEYGKNYLTEVDKEGLGHGTHVAGIVASKDYGVAPNAQIISVKVKSKVESSPAWITADAVSWVIEHAKEAYKKRKTKSVVNLSLGGESTNSLWNELIHDMFKANITVVASSGNEASYEKPVDACTKDPASSKKAITVAATTKEDAFAPFSNSGACVDLLAPGHQILSLEPGSTTKVRSGTSMAAPFVSGILALILSNGKEFKTPGDAKKYIVNLGEPQKIKFLPDGTTNRMAYNGAPSCEGSDCNEL